jgi:hypothetical protein
VSAHNQVSDLIEIILLTVAQEAKTTQDELSVEVESVITRGVLEAFKRGTEQRPTAPPPPTFRQPTPRDFPVVRNRTPPGPIPAYSENPTRRLPTPPTRPRIPSPMPKTHRRRRNHNDK